MRLIDLDDVRHTYCGDSGEYERWSIDPNLLVDAVPVIRCNDCRYNADCVCVWHSGNDYTWIVVDDDYCSCAERKEK